MVDIRRGTSILKIYTDVYVENHGGSIKIPTCAVDRTDTVQMAAGRELRLPTEIRYSMPRKSGYTYKKKSRPS